MSHRWVPQAEIDRIKQTVPVADLVRSAGVELKRHGADLLGLCPFHDDREPSLVVTPAKNLWHCLGACSEGGSVIDWVMKLDGVTFRQAVERLRHVSAAASSAATSATSSTSTPEKRSHQARLETAESSAVDDATLLDSVVSYYHQTLLDSPQGLQYLESRGLGSREAIEHFRLGLGDRTLGYRLPSRGTKAGKAMRSRLQTLGIVRASGHEHFNGSLVIPVLSAEGHVVEMYGRKITSSLRKGTPKHLYLPGPHHGVWNLAALEASDDVILCESLLDALTFWVAGFRQVTSAYGVQGLTDEHVEALRAHGVERVLIAFDADVAGDGGAQRAAARLSAAGIGCWRVRFPQGLDANAYALEAASAPQSLGRVLREAEWMGEGKAPERPMVASSGPSMPVEPTPESSSPPEPPSPPEPAMSVKDHEIVLDLGDPQSQPRRYRVRGLERNLTYDVMKVNLLASRGEAFHIDTLDLYSARQRGAFLKQATSELGVASRVLTQDLGRVLLALETLQEAQIQKLLDPETPRVELSRSERSEALELLRDPRLLARILEDFERCGVVGEETNKLVGYLASISRKLERPLAVLIQSSSAAGKSALMESVLALVPEEERVQYSAMTGQSLFYMGEKDLRHKVLAIAEEEGAEQASYALKLLQSEGRLSIASTGKDPSSGRLQTHEYEVEGPVALLLTTTSIDVDEELMNRCLVLSVDEGREQTRAIHAQQRARETLEGQLLWRRRSAVRRLHQNAQRLLEPMLVINPYAGELRFPDGCTRTRRDHEKYLGLIRAVALLHQHQRRHLEREDRGEVAAFIEVTLDDIEVANRLAHEVLGRTLDALPPQTRRLLERLGALVEEACEREGLERKDFRFTRRWVRELTGWGNTQLKVHMARLADLEYLVVHRGVHAQRYVYELMYDGQGEDGGAFVPGLIGVSALRRGDRSGPEANRSESEAHRSAPGRPVVGGRPGGGRGREERAESETYAQNLEAGSRSHRRGADASPSSYVSARALPASGNA